MLTLITAVGCTTAQTVSHRFLNAEVQVRSQERPCEVSRQSST